VQPSLTLGGQHVGVGAARHKPQKLLSHALPPDPLGGEKREGLVAQAKAHLAPKLGKGAWMTAPGGTNCLSLCEPLKREQTNPLPFGHLYRSRFQ